MEFDSAFLLLRHSELQTGGNGLAFSAGPLMIFTGIVWGEIVKHGMEDGVVGENFTWLGWLSFFFMRLGAHLHCLAGYEVMIVPDFFRGHLRSGSVVWILALLGEQVEG